MERCGKKGSARRGGGMGERDWRPGKKGHEQCAQGNGIKKRKFMEKTIEFWGESDVSYKVLLIIWRSAPCGQGRQENADKNPHF